VRPLFEKTVVKQFSRWLDAYGASGETVLQHDLVQDDSGYFVKGRPQERRLTAFATDRAVYFWFHGRVVGSLRYDGVAYVADHGRELVVHSGEVVRLSYVFEYRGVGDVIKEQLLRLDSYSETRDIAGSEVTLTYQPWRPDTMSYWMVKAAQDADATGPAAEEEAGMFRLEAGEAVLERARPEPVSTKTPVDWLKRNWTTPLNALLSHHGLADAVSWTPGYELDAQGAGGPVIIGVNDDNVFTATFESMGRGFSGRAPRLVVYPYWRIADWETRSEPDGRGLIRFLTLHDEALDLTSLDDVVNWGVTSESGFNIVALGLALPERVKPISDAIVNGIVQFGAFSPKTRKYHPLQGSGRGSLDYMLLPEHAG
jgi:hypothetical protein